MEANQFRERAIVVAVVLCSVVKRSTVRAERASNKDVAFRKFSGYRASKRNRTQQCSIGTLRRQADLGITHTRDLIATSGYALGTCLNVGAMRGCNLVRFVFEHMGRPERAVNARAQEFELRGEAAVDDMDTAQDCIPAISSVRHEEMLPPANRN